MNRLPRYIWFFCIVASLLSLWLLSSEDGARAGQLCEGEDNPFFAESPEGVFTAKRSRAFPEKFSMPKPAGAKRIFVVGGSAAVLLGPGGQVSAAGASGTEIINCGVDGYAGARVNDITGEVLRYSPDLVIIPGVDRQNSIGTGGGVWYKLRRAKARLLELYYSLKYDSRLAAELVSTGMQGELFSKAARAAKKAGIPVIFCTRPANIRDMPPRIPLHIDDFVFASGYRSFYEKKYQAAFDKFSAALTAKPGNAHFNFYVAKTLEKLGKTGEARQYYLTADNPDKNTPAGNQGWNAMIKRAASSEGACVADLEGLFYKLSKDALPGFREFADDIHWRPSYNKAVWEELFRAAEACGLKGFGPVRVAGASESSRIDAVKRLTYAADMLDENGFSEAALAEFSYLREKSPGLLKQAAVSAEALGLLLCGAGSSRTDAGLTAVFPFFLAHLAETERRDGKYTAALALCKRALSLKHGNRQFTLELAQVLAGMGRRKEAQENFSALADTGSREAEALMAAYGFFVVPRSSAVVSRKEIKPAEEKSEGEKLSDLCFAKAGDKASRELALLSCQSVVYLAGSGELRDKRAPGMLESDASFRSYKLLSALGRVEEAREALLWTVSIAPASWPDRPKALKELEGSGPAR